MATQTSKSSSKAKPKAKVKATAAAPQSRRDQARAAAEAAVDVPVGVVLEVGDVLGELVEPFTGRSAAERQLKAYRTRLRRSVKRAERRGASVRRRQQRSVKTTLRRNRTEVGQRLRKAAEAQASRAQSLVDQVGEQLSALR